MCRAHRLLERLELRQRDACIIRDLIVLGHLLVDGVLNVPVRAWSGLGLGLGTRLEMHTVAGWRRTVAGWRRMGCRLHTLGSGVGLGSGLVLLPVRTRSCSRRLGRRRLGSEIYLGLSLLAAPEMTHVNGGAGGGGEEDLVVSGER